MDESIPEPDPLDGARRRSPRTAGLAAPDWLFSAVIHLLLVAVLLSSKAGPGGGTGDGNGRGDGGDGLGERWIETYMGSAGDGAPPAPLAIAVIEDAHPLPVPESTPLPSDVVHAVPRPPSPIEQTSYVPPPDAAIPSATDSSPGTASAPTNQSASVGASTSGHSGGGAAGDGSPGDGGDGQGGTSLFGIWDAGERFVYVIDRSSSMADYGKFAAARGELAASLARLDESIEFQVLLYNQEVQQAQRRGTRGLQRATLINRNQTLRQLRIVLPEGGTQHLDALQSALQLRPTVIYFLTDAEDPGLTPTYIRELARRLRGTTRIHCIQFGENPGRGPTDGNWLQQLAEATGGEYVHVPTEALHSAADDSAATR